MAITKADLLAAKVAEHSYEVEGVGEVRYRGLTRGEVTRLQDRFQGKKTAGAEADCAMLATGVVDPALSEAEWREVADTVPAGLLEGLSQAIAEQSGARLVDAKEAYAQFRDEL